MSSPARNVSTALLQMCGFWTSVTAVVSYREAMKQPRLLELSCGLLRQSCLADNIHTYIYIYIYTYRYIQYLEPQTARNKWLFPVVKIPYITSCSEMVGWGSRNGHHVVQMWGSPRKLPFTSLQNVLTRAPRR